MMCLLTQDMEAVDPQYYSSLCWILNNPVKGSGMDDENFTVEVEYFGSKETVELKAGGQHIKVTDENKREYVDLLARHRMTTAIKGQIQSFLTGFWDLIPKVCLSLHG